MAIEFTKTVPADLVELAANMIPADEAEIRAMGFEPLAGLQQTFEVSIETVTARVDGELATVFGISRPLALGHTHPWMISTPLIFNHRRELLRLSKRIINHWLTNHGELTNLVDERHTRAVRWLKWLGATVEPVPDYGPYRRPFLQFTFGEN